MARVVFLLPLVIFALRHDLPAGGGYDQRRLLLFFAVLAGIILLTNILLQRLSQGITAQNLTRRTAVGSKITLVAQVLMLGWFVFAVISLGWGQATAALVGRLPVLGSLAEVVVGTLPIYAAFVGLLGGQFLMDRAVREQAVMGQLAQNLPVRMPPRLVSYVLQKIRVNMLFVLAPVWLAVATMDLCAAAGGLLPGRWLERLSPEIRELGSSAVAIGCTLVVAPWLLSRVLHTSAMDDAAMLGRIDRMLRGAGKIGQWRASGLRPKLRVWHTDGLIANAAAMGVFPGTRYVLLSDLLLETMTDEQIEAVLAHEMGHVVHRHIVWLAMLFIAMGLCWTGLFAAMEGWLAGLVVPASWERIVAAGWAASGLLALGLSLLTFGYVSRRFELQADAFAARVMVRQELTPAIDPLSGAADPGAATPGVTATDEQDPGQPLTRRAVLPASGALYVLSALHRIAVVNNSPLTAWNLTHGSLAWRISHLQKLVVSEVDAVAFLAVQRRLRFAIVLGLLLGAGACAVVLPA